VLITVLLFHHSVFLCSLTWIDRDVWEFSKFHILSDDLQIYHSQPRDLLSECNWKVNSGNLLKLNPAKFTMLPICRGHLLGPLSPLFLSDDFIRQRALVLLLTMIWVRVIMLVFSFVRFMELLLGWWMLPLLLFIYNFHFHLLRLCNICTWLLFTEETYGGISCLCQVCLSMDHIFNVSYWILLTYMVFRLVCFMFSLVPGGRLLYLFEGLVFSLSERTLTLYMVGSVLVRGIRAKVCKISLNK
jgi:hypothetical protein